MDASVKIVLSVVGAGAVAGAIKSVTGQADRSYRILQRHQEELKGKYRTLADSVKWFGERSRSVTDMTIRRMAVLKRQIEGVRAQMRKLALEDLQSRWTDLVAVGGAAMAARGVVGTQARSEAALRDIAITVGVARTADEARLGGIVEQVARQTRLAMDEVRMGMARLAAGGLSDVEEFGRIMPEVAKAAKAWRANTEDMAALVLVARDTLGVTDARRALNIVGTGGKLGEFEIPDMTRYLPSLAPQLAAIGLRGEQGLAQGVGYLQAARKGAGSAEEASANFANFLAKVTSREFADRWKDLTGRHLAQDQAALMAKGYDAVGATLKLIEAYMKRQGKGELMSRLATGTDAQAQAAIAELQQAHGLGELFTDMQAARFIRAAMMYRSTQQQVASEALRGSPLEADFAHAIDTTDSAMQRLATAWEGLTGRIGRAIKPVTDWILNAGAASLEWLGDLMDAFPTVTRGIVTAGAAAMGFFATMRAVRVAAAAWRVLRLAGGFGPLAGMLTRLKIVTSSAAAPLRVVASWAGKAAGVLSTMGGKLVGLGARVAATLAPVGKAALAVVSPIAKLAAAFAGGYAIGTLLSKGIDALLTKLMDTPTSLGSAIYDGVQAIQAAWSEAVAWVSSAADRMIASAKESVQGAVAVIGSAWDALRNVPEQMLATGRQIIDGLLAGIRERWAALKEGVSSIGSSISGWVKDKLGIRSPSRVFAEIGGHLMGGLRLGIERAAGLPLAAMRGVAAGLATPIMAGAVAFAPLAQAVEPVALPEPVDAVRTIRQAVEPVALPEPVDAVRTIRQAVEPVVLPEPAHRASALPPGTPPQAPNAAPIQIIVNLNGPASPEAAQDVAAAVRREVERALAEQARRDALARRARLIDGGIA